MVKRNVYSIPYDGASQFIAAAGFNPIGPVAFRSFREEAALQTLRDISNDPLAAGVVVCGGEDIDPAIYGGKTHPATSFGDREKDLAEIRVIRESPVPVFGFCRGHQLCHVALSCHPNFAMLDQHLTAHLNEFTDSHGLRLLELVSRCPNIYGKYGLTAGSVVRVNSLHHQGVYMRDAMEELFPSMEILGVSDTPTPVAEMAHWLNESGREVLGVQYHPELMIRPFDVRLLTSLFGEAEAA